MPAKSTTVTETNGTTINPSRIMQVGMGFFASKAMLAAVRLGLFTALGPAALPAKEIKRQLGLGCIDRHVFDWLDTLVSLGFLERNGLLENALYSNAADTGLFLDKNKPSYMGGILEMANNRLYGHWVHLEDGLLTGRQQNEGKDDPSGDMFFFNDLYKDEAKLREFMDAMSGIQTGNFMALTHQFDFGRYNTMLDIGGANGWLSIQVCQRYKNIRCTSFDLPPVKPLAEKMIAGFNLGDRITAVAGDFQADELPGADIITMGNILHGMNEASKERLIRKVYNTLPAGGVFIAIENVIDDNRNQNTFGMLMSLNMLIENGDGFDYTANDFKQWATAAGFARVELMPLTGPASAAIAYK